MTALLISGEQVQTGEVPAGARTWCQPFRRRRQTRSTDASQSPLRQVPADSLDGAHMVRFHPGERRMPLPNPLITSTPERLGGTPVFAGTRVPVQTLLDYFEGGDSLDDFLLDFPTVTREHAIAVLEAAKSALLTQTAAA